MRIHAIVKKFRIMNEKPLEERRAGILVPVFAMRHRDDFGIGDTRAVREAIDFCAEHGFKVLQMLPVLETFGDHSPYNPICSRALSPAYIHLDPAEVPGLTTEDLERAAPLEWRSRLRSGIVKHGSVHPLKIHILQHAWDRFLHGDDCGLMNEFTAFTEQESHWLPQYTLFRLLIREYEGNTEWLDWRPEHQSWALANEWMLRHPDREELEDVRAGYAFAQWVAHRQWDGVREHADSKGIWLMGEISFGVGRGSADVWANPDLFDLEWNMGSRPMQHFDTNRDAERWGQNWGLPPYRWENHRASGYAWLKSRVKGVRRFFHICRLDHLRGYFRVYMFPWPGGARHSEFSNLSVEEAALKTGGKLPRFIPGPDDDPASANMNDLQGRELISIIRAEAGPMELIGELMGELPDYMARALEELPIANLAFPQLGRLSHPEGPAGMELRELALATYANHDNAPLASLYLHLSGTALQHPTGLAAAELKWLLAFAGWQGEAPADFTDELLYHFQRALMESRSRLAVLMCSDVFGTQLRFNLPGSYGIETWCDRLDFPLSDYAHHAIFGPRLRRLKEIITQSHRDSLDNVD